MSVWMMKPVRALGRLITWATLVRLSRAMPVGFRTLGWQRRSLPCSLAELVLYAPVPGWDEKLSSGPTRANNGWST